MSLRAFTSFVGEFRWSSKSCVPLYNFYNYIFQTFHIETNIESRNAAMP